LSRNEPARSCGNKLPQAVGIRRSKGLRALRGIPLSSIFAAIAAGLIHPLPALDPRKNSLEKRPDFPPAFFSFIWNSD
jgi:hypothetical protein